MCTVSFYKSNHQIVITSNRDEHISRPLALAPQKMTYNNAVFFCPIDPKSNGTWFGVKDDNSVLVLLNGAANHHVAAPPYRKSRGLIFLDLISAEQPTLAWNEINLLGIEPFTLIVFAGGELAQLRWNGTAKTLVLLDTNLAHIWSSATLYDAATMQQRKDWFSDFLNRKQIVNAADLIDFHTNTQKGNLQNGLLINRNQTMLTKNVTQCVLKNNSFTLTHFDLITHQKTKLHHENAKTLVT